jgi:hypothetical protein
MAKGYEIIYLNLYKINVLLIYMTNINKKIIEETIRLMEMGSVKRIEIKDGKIKLQSIGDYTPSCCKENSDNQKMGLKEIEVIYDKNRDFNGYPNNSIGLIYCTDCQKFLRFMNYE